MQKGNVRAVYADGNPAYTKYIRNVNFEIKPEDGFPILQSKRVAWKTAFKEIDWIYRQMSSDVDLLNKEKVHIWDEWSTPPEYYLKGREIVSVEPILTSEDFGTPVLNRPLKSNGYDWSIPLDASLADTWRNMVDRCYNEKHVNYKSYGGKGVQVCPRWWDFDNFYIDVQKIPNFQWKKKFPYDFNLDKDYYSSNYYSPETCSWISKQENSWYTSNSEQIAMELPTGKTNYFISIGQAELETGISRTTLSKIVLGNKKVDLDKLYNLKKFDGVKFYKTNQPLLRLKHMDNTIGLAYGAQIRSKVRGGMNQVEYVIHEIINNPSSRRIMTTLYDIDDLPYMALEPCVWTTNWNVDDDDKLHLFVKQRSCDVANGFPFNVSQYAMLHRRIAQVTGKELGSMYWTIDNAHIYDRHLEVIEEQVTADISHLETTEPKLTLPESRDYFGTPLYEANIENYKHNGSYKYEIAI